MFNGSQLNPLPVQQNSTPIQYEPLHPDNFSHHPPHGYYMNPHNQFSQQHAHPNLQNFPHQTPYNQYQYLYHSQPNSHQIYPGEYPCVPGTQSYHPAYHPQPADLSQQNHERTSLFNGNSQHDPTDMNRQGPFPQLPPTKRDPSEEMMEVPSASFDNCDGYKTTLYRTAEEQKEDKLQCDVICEVGDFNPTTEAPTASSSENNEHTSESVDIKSKHLANEEELENSNLIGMIKPQPIARDSNIPSLECFSNDRITTPVNATRYFDENHSQKPEEQFENSPQIEDTSDGSTEKSSPNNSDHSLNECKKATQVENRSNESAILGEDAQENIYENTLSEDDRNAENKFSERITEIDSTVKLTAASSMSSKEIPSVIENNSYSHYTACQQGSMKLKNSSSTDTSSVSSSVNSDKSKIPIIKAVDTNELLKTNDETDEARTHELCDQFTKEHKQEIHPSKENSKPSNLTPLDVFSPSLQSQILNTTGLENTAGVLASVINKFCMPVKGKEEEGVLPKSIQNAIIKAFNVVTSTIKKTGSCKDSEELAKKSQDCGHPPTVDNFDMKFNNDQLGTLLNTYEKAETLKENKSESLHSPSKELGNLEHHSGIPENFKTDPISRYAEKVSPCKGMSDASFDATNYSQMNQETLGEESEKNHGSVNLAAWTLHNKLLLQNLPPNVVSAIMAAAAVAEVANGQTSSKRNGPLGMFPANVMRPIPADSEKNCHPSMQSHRVDRNLQQHLNSHFMLSVKHMHRSHPGYNLHHHLSPIHNRNCGTAERFMQDGPMIDSYHRSMLEPRNRTVAMATPDASLKNNCQDVKNSLDDDTFAVPKNSLKKITTEKWIEGTRHSKSSEYIGLNLWHI